MRTTMVLLLSVAGCQCFEPVNEVPTDGGRRDAGVVVDAGPECLTAADCPKPNENVTCEFGGPATARSCVDGRCVFDCHEARTCTTKGTGSLDLVCDGGTGCMTTTCSNLNGVTGRVSKRCDTTWQPLGDFAIRYAQGATCDFVISVDGGGFGTLHAACDQRSNATVNEEGAVTCTVRSIPTALERWELGCARCMYLLEWP